MNNVKKCNFKPYQMFLPLNYDDSIETDIPIDDISRTVNDVVERMNVGKYIDLSNRDSYGYDGVMLLKCIILAMSLKVYHSLRDLEEKCKFDIRFKYICQGQKPGFMSFWRFMHDDLTMPIDDIFIKINKLMEEDIDIVTDILNIDGSKWEANANKMTFVWRASTEKYYSKLWKNVVNLIERINRYFKREGIDIYYSVLKEPDIAYLIEISERLVKYAGYRNIEFVHGKGKRRSEIQKLNDELKKYAVSLYKYTLHFDILGDRNSFSKTDPDATFLKMKYDYYNHTGVFKPGYNVQIGTSGDGFIRNIYVSSDANDIKTYIPFMKKYYLAYGEYPSKTPADAGYGSFDNYKFCERHKIELYMKYSGYYKETQKKSKKNQFKAAFMRQDDGSYVCPAGHKFVLLKETLNKKGVYEKVNQTLINEHCEGCPLKSKCTKSKGNRQIVHCEEYDQMKEVVKDNLSTDEGKKLMAGRSVYAEGTFGILKEDYHYDRFRRRGESGVKLEITLMAIGFNMRKYHKRMLEKRKAANGEMRPLIGVN